ncbi:MAG TPA: hypothetical protein VHU84_05175 [Lacipirellulaceae bacterium]|jgi:hypothetical protein|nr:hypothetical protein [Lacipirellulaceae bacterium]
MTRLARYRFWLAFASLLILAIIGYSLLAREVPQKADSTEPDFSGKIVVVIIDRSSAVERREDTEVIENASMVQVGNRPFIIGKAYSPEGVEANWRTGSDVGVAWEKVQVYYAYTPEQFKNYAKRWSESEGKDDK